MKKNLLHSLTGLLLLAAGAAAQTTNATIVGDILDAQGASISGAKITVKSGATGTARAGESDSNGQFRIFPLLPGSYEVTASAPGFSTQVRKDVVLEVAATVKVDFRLAVGQASESVTVNEAAPLLQTQDASVGNIVTGTELARLPVNGRNYTKLILLSPGTSTAGGSQNQGTFSGTALYSVNGQRMQDNNYTIDGVENNFFFQNSPGLSPPMDAIQEFKLLNNTSAEFGRSAGANVNIAIQSGSRDLHGSLYEYFRNDQLDANDFFNNKLGKAKLPYRQNQYGVSMGGPVVLPKVYNGRNKTFWFADWEGYRQRQGVLSLSNTPVQTQRDGNFAGANPIYDPFTGTLASNGSILRTPFPGNVIPTNRISKATALFLNSVIPLPNLPGATNNLVNTRAIANDRDLWNLRADQNLGARDFLFFRYSSQNVGYTNPTSNLYVTSVARYDIRNFATAWNHVFSPSMVLEVKMGYNNPNLPIHDENAKITRAQFLQQSGIQMFQTDVPFGPLPALSASGSFSYPVGTGGGGSITEDHVYQPKISLTKVWGRHSLKFGGEFQVRQFYQTTANPMSGSATFDTRLTSLSTISASGNSLASMLLGTPSSISRASGTTETQGRGPYQAYYAQDDFRVNAKLTLNIGLRYEYATPAYSLSNNIGSLTISRDATTGAYSPVLLWANNNSFTGAGPNQQGYGRALQTPDRTNFGPRVGFAYQLDSKTVVRSAFGIFYDSTFFQELLDKVKFYPYVPQQVITANTGTVPDLLITDPGPAYSTNIGGWAQSPHKKTPYSEQWNLTIQRQLARDLSLEVAYFGSGNRHQIGYTYINQAVTPGPGSVDPRRLLQGIGDLNGGLNEFTSNYHSFRTNVVKRYSNGLQVHANYTWGKVLTTQSSLSQSIAQNQSNRRADYGPADFDVRHTFQADYVYDLPFGKGRKFGANWNGFVDAVLGGWSTEGIVRVQAGSPLNIIDGTDRANIGASAQRPNVLRNPNNGGTTNSDVPWFDTTAFQLQPAYTYGNAGVSIVTGPGRRNWDMAVQKSWKLLREKQTLQFRGEFFNVANHINFGNPPSGNLQVTSVSFGKVTTATTARQVQLGLRFAF